MNRRYVQQNQTGNWPVQDTKDLLNETLLDKASVLCLALGTLK